MIQSFFEQVTMREWTAFAAGVLAMLIFRNVTWIIGRLRKKDEPTLGRQEVEELIEKQASMTRSYIAPIIVVAIIGLISELIRQIVNVGISLDEAKAKALSLIGDIENRFGADSYTSAAKQRVRNAVTKTEIADILNGVMDHIKKKYG